MPCRSSSERENRPLRRERREGRRGAQGHRVPRRRDGPDHLQYVPPAACGAVLRGSQAPRHRRHRPRPTRVRAAHWQTLPGQELAENDHRNFNRRARRSTAARRLPDSRSTRARRSRRTPRARPRANDDGPDGATLDSDHDAVSTVIPGSTSPDHVRANAAVSEMAPLSNQVHGAVRDIYEEYVFEDVHHRW